VCVCVCGNISASLF